jgi:4-amino-4-deoxy-L-arabinose transferase-like glycosyltransferase
MEEKTKRNINLRWSSIIILIVSIYILSFSFFPKERLVCSVSDDAYYYLQISRNIAQGNGSTFDGIGKTNGYHPLWLFILIPVHFIVGFSRIGALRAVFVIQAIFYFLTVIIILRGLKRESDYIGLISILAISLYPRFFHILTVGLESSLLLFLLALFWFYLIRFFNSKGSIMNALILGLLLGLVILSRFEAGIILAFITLIFILIFRYRNWKIRTISVVLTSGFTAVLFILPFLIWNYVSFGHIMTISASLKSSFPHPLFHYNYLMTYPEYYIGVILFLFILFLRRNTTSDRILSDIVIGILSLIMVISFLLFGRWAHFSHHYAPTLLPIFIFTAIFVEGVYKKISKIVSPRFVGIIIILFLIIFSGYSQYIVHKDTLKSFRKVSFEGAMWASENTDKSAIFAMKDCGTFGYFSDRRTINLDGVVNDFVYQDYLRDGRLNEYLKLTDVDYIVQHSVPLKESDYGVYEQIYPCRLYGGEDSKLELKKEDEVFRSQFYVDEGGSSSILVIWRFHKNI